MDDNAQFEFAIAIYDGISFVEFHCFATLLEVMIFETMYNDYDFDVVCLLTKLVVVTVVTFAPLNLFAS